MKKQKTKIRGFTLVELIIVITILAILATIAFVSFKGYMADSRDSNRLATINSIEKGLSLYQIKSGSYPMPESYITITSSGSPIGYQGFFGDISSKSTNFNKTPLDPLDNVNYTYNVNTNLDNYQITGFFENSSNIAFENNLISKTYAGNIDYSTRIVKSFGKELGVLLINTGSDINRPLHEKYNTTSFTGIDVKFFTGILSDGTNIGNLTAKFNNKTGDDISGTGSNLSRLESIYKGIYRLVMDGCPNGWQDLGNSSGLGTATLVYSGGLSTGIYTKICETTKTLSISKGFRVIMPTCSAGWQEIGKRGILLTAAQIYVGGVSTGIIPSVCESDGTDIIVGDKIMMDSCPVGWSNVGQVGILGTAKCNSNFDFCKICQKK